ncbi:MAG: hypothetical protein KKC46_20070 [Proteobacteria bacterium]|nr:hypothetical protein [Pseudomonadota bacterium]
MNSNQDSGKAFTKYAILKSGIDVMNELSLDAADMIDLANEGFLIPCLPAGATTKKRMNFAINSPEITLCAWLYWNYDIEDFKLKHKDYLEKLRLKNVTSCTESQKQKQLRAKAFKLASHIKLVKDQGRFAEIGKKGGSKEKINEPILEAIIRYIQENPKNNNKPSEFIAKQFCKKYKSDNKFASVSIDKEKYEVYCYSERIYSRKHKNNDEKSIAYSTFRSRYIKKAKDNLKTSLT